MRAWLTTGAAVLACCSFLVTHQARADDVFEGLGPELIGDELTSVLENAELACYQDPADDSIRRCKPLEGSLDVLNGVPALAEALFIDEELAQVAVTFPEARFADIRKMLGGRLGPPRDWSVTIRAGMSGALKDEILLWETSDLTAVLQQYDRKLDRSSLTYGTPAALATLLRQIKSTPPGAMRDL